MYEVFGVTSGKSGTHLVLTLFSMKVLLFLHVVAFGVQVALGSVTSDVVGVVGGKVALPCNITPPSQDDAVSLVLWYKEDSTTPIYSLDARKGNLDQARHASTETLTTRSYFSTLQKSAHLLIENLVEEDAGIYRCRADFRKARTRNFAVNLIIIVPPERPVIKDSNEEVLPSLVGPFNEGDSLTLTCETQGGKPRPSLTWWRESVLLDDSEESNSRDVVRNRLEIKSLQRHDLMAVLTCAASNNNISAPVSAQVTIDLNFRPLLVRIDGDRKPLSADKMVEISCTGAGSRPPAAITWWKGTKQMKRTREKISVDGNITTSILSFTPTSDDSGKHLSCRAENPLISGSAIEDGYKLEIYCKSTFLTLFFLSLRFRGSYPASLRYHRHLHSLLPSHSFRLASSLPWLGLLVSHLLKFVLFHSVPPRLYSVPARRKQNHSESQSWWSHDLFPNDDYCQDSSPELLLIAFCPNDRRDDPTGPSLFISCITSLLFGIYFVCLTERERREEGGRQRRVCMSAACCLPTFYDVSNYQKRRGKGERKRGKLFSSVTISGEER